MKLKLQHYHIHSTIFKTSLIKTRLFFKNSKLNVLKTFTYSISSLLYKMSYEFKTKSCFYKRSLKNIRQQLIFVLIKRLKRKYFSFNKFN